MRDDFTPEELDRLEELESIEAELPTYDPRWIPVTDRLPPEGVDVLWHDGRTMKSERPHFVGRREGRFIDWGADLDLELRHMTHWMPLPEPPAT